MSWMITGETTFRLTFFLQSQLEVIQTIRLNLAPGILNFGLRWQLPRTLLVLEVYFLRGVARRMPSPARSLTHYRQRYTWFSEDESWFFYFYFIFWLREVFYDKLTSVLQGFLHQYHQSFHLLVLAIEFCAASFIWCSIQTLIRLCVSFVLLREWISVSD